MLHFYCIEVSVTEFLCVERRGLAAPEFGVEVLGLVRGPLYTRTHKRGGLPQFLRNNFVGNSRQQLLDTLVSKEVLSQAEVRAALTAR